LVLDGGVVAKDSSASCIIAKGKHMIESRRSSSAEG
jgi:hypothetical protein